MRSVVAKACLMVVALCIASTAFAQKKDVWLEFGPGSSHSDFASVTLRNDTPNTVLVTLKITHASKAEPERILDIKRAVGKYQRKFLGYTCRPSGPDECDTKITYEIISWTKQ